MTRFQDLPSKFRVSVEVVVVMPDLIGLFHYVARCAEFHTMGFTDVAFGHRRRPLGLGVCAARVLEASQGQTGKSAHIYLATFTRDICTQYIPRTSRPRASVTGINKSTFICLELAQFLS
jgi:hypothetical protein